MSEFFWMGLIGPAKGIQIYVFHILDDATRFNLGPKA